MVSMTTKSESIPYGLKIWRVVFDFAGHYNGMRDIIGVKPTIADSKLYALSSCTKVDDLE